LAEAPQQLLVSGQLLIAAASDGVALLNVANPTRPGIVQVLRSAVINGATTSLRPVHIHLEGQHLVVESGTSTRVHRVVFDLSEPGAPQLSAVSVPAGHKAGLRWRPV